jgi:hypothetical protein
MRNIQQKEQGLFSDCVNEILSSILHVTLCYHAYAIRRRSNGYQLGRQVEKEFGQHCQQ